MTFYFKQGTTFDRLANGNTGTSNTASAGVTVYDASYVYPGVNTTFALQTALDTQQSFTNSFVFTSITGTVSSAGTTATTSLVRDKVSYTMPITSITGTLNAGTATIGNNITITGTGTFFNTKLPSSNTYRQITGYDGAGNPIYASYSSTLLIANLPITGTVTIAAQTPVAPDYRLYISGTGTRFLSDLLVTGGNTSTGVLNETLSPIVQPGQSAPVILVDNAPISGSFTWTSNGTVITGFGSQFLSQLVTGSTITLLKPISGRLYQTTYMPASAESFQTTINTNTTGITYPPPASTGIAIMYGATSTCVWVCPAGVTSVHVVCIGAGGNGVTTTTSLGLYSGGGGGGLGWYRTFAVTPGSSYTVNIGLPSAVSGGTGGDTWFSSTTTVRGTGGIGGGTTRAGGTFNGQGGGAGGAGGIGSAGSTGGGGGGGAGGYWGTGGAGGVGYDTTYAAGSGGTAPGAGSVGAGKSAGGGGGGQLTTQTVPLGRGGAVDPYYATTNSSALVTAAAVSAGSPGSHGGDGVVQDYFFGNGGCGGPGATLTQGSAQGGYGVCYIIYAGNRPYDWAGTSLTNRIVDPTVNIASDRRYTRTDIVSPFPIHLYNKTTSYQTVYIYSPGVVAFTSSVGDYLGTLYAANFPTIEVLASFDHIQRQINWQVEGATPNRKLKIHYWGAARASYQTTLAEGIGTGMTAYDSTPSHLNSMDFYFSGADGTLNYNEGLFYNSAAMFSYPNGFYDDPGVSVGSATYNSGITTYWSSTLLGAAALTVSSTATSGSATNGYWRLATPFPINFYGSSYSTLFVSHHSRISFGDWIGLDSSTTITNDPRTGTSAIYNGPAISIYRSSDFLGWTPSGGQGYQIVGWFDTSTGTSMQIIDWPDPASCQRIYYGTEGTSPNRRYRIRYEGDSSLTQTAGNSKYIWEITFFESSYGLSSSSPYKHGTFAIANGVKGELTRKRYYPDPSGASAAGVFGEIGYWPQVLLMNPSRVEPYNWSSTSKTALASWGLTAYNVNLQTVMMAQSATATTAASTVTNYQYHPYYRYNGGSYGLYGYIVDVYTGTYGFSAAGSYAGNNSELKYGPQIITPYAGESMGVQNASNTGNLSIFTTKIRNVYDYNINWEMTIPENSAAGITVASGTLPNIYISQIGGSNGFSVREATNNDLIASSNFNDEWWQYRDAGQYLGIYGLSGQEISADKQSLPVARYPWRTDTFNIVNLSAFVAAKNSTVPTPLGTPIIVKLHSVETEHGGFNPINAPISDANYDYSNNVVANSQNYYRWPQDTINGSQLLDLTSNSVYYPATMSSIARHPQDGYNATAANSNPNPTCASTVQICEYVRTQVQTGSSGGGKYGGSTPIYTYYYNTTQPYYGNPNERIFLFSYGSSAATHSRFLMSKTTYGRYHTADVGGYVSNPYRNVGSFSSTPNTDSNADNYANIFGFVGSSTSAVLPSNPGIGEDLELWYHASPEPQPPTAGQSPAVLGWTKYSTMFTASGTANQSLPRTPYSATKGGFSIFATISNDSPGYNTWLIWQKSFATQTTSNARLSEYAVSRFDIATRVLNSNNTYVSQFSYTNNIVGKLKLEVTSGATLRIPTLTSKNSPVWGSYADYIVAENPADHVYGMVYTSLIPLSSTTTSTPNASYINSWSTSGTTSAGVYWPGLQAVPAYIVETRTIATISNDTTMTVTVPTKSTSNDNWGGGGGGDLATGSATRAFAIDRVYSNTSMSVVAAYGQPAANIGSVLSAATGRTATADRRFTIVSIASATSMTVSGGGIYAPFTAKTSTFPQRESGLFTISGYHDGSNLTANTTWVSGGVPGIDQFGIYYGAEYLSTTRAQIGNTSFAIVSINSNTSITLSGVAITSNFYDQSLQFRWSAPSSTITMIGTGTKFLPDTTGNITTKQIQLYSSSDVRIGRIYIGSSSFSVVGITNDTTMTVSGFVGAGFTGATVSAYRETITYAVARTLASTGTATWDKTGTAIGVDDSLVVQPYDVDFGVVTELFNTTSDALLYTAQQLVVDTSITVADATSSILLLVTWMKDFYTNSPYESSNTLDINISSIGTFTVAYDAELQRNYKDYAGGRTLMYSGLSFITTSLELTISSTTITGATTSTAVINWQPANRLRSGTYGRLVAKLSNLTNTSVSIKVDAGSTGWNSATEDFLNITVIGAD